MNWEIVINSDKCPYCTVDYKCKAVGGYTTTIPCAEHNCPKVFMEVVRV